MKQSRKNGIKIAAALSLAALSLCGCAAETPVPVAGEAAPAQIATPMATPYETAAPQITATPAATPAITPTPAPETQYTAQVVCTAKESVNIRAGAGTDTEVLGHFPAGETAGVIADEGDWVRIAYGGIEGYVSADYVIAVHAPSVAVPSGDWTMILINKWNRLPEGFTVELADFEGGQVDARILEICTQMFADAAEDGAELQLVDAYRSYETQRDAFEEKVQSYVNQGYSREAAEEKASTITARPNTSEHQTGLALDIVTPSHPRRNSGIADTQAFKWLNANAFRYGFIMRYAKDKTEKTGVIFEPWHWRFVGAEAAQAVKESGQCWEEYLGAD
jgi:D-alanyl-D-alanine carboxypeptidase